MILGIQKGAKAQEVKTITQNIKFVIRVIEIFTFFHN